MSLELSPSNYQRQKQIVTRLLTTFLGISLFLVISLITLHTTAHADTINTTDFVTTWKTDNPGTSNSTSITIPTYSGETYNYSVDWNNDGIFEPEDTGITGNVTHDYGTAGIKTIRIKGDFPRIYFNYGGDKEKIININQWGTNVWSSMDSAFMGASNLTSDAMDAPNLSNVTDMSTMFYYASAFNSDLSAWDTSNVTYMSDMFAAATTFNSDLSSWDTSNVTDMSTMFSGATAFNSDLSAWETSNVTDMSFMFANTSAFNGDLSSWDTASVTDMSVMFNASIFNGNISSWNTGNVTNMSSMFLADIAFDQDISSWNTIKVSSMARMFYQTFSFDQDLSSWDMSSVMNVDDMLSDNNLSVANYNATLVGWANQELQHDLSLGANGLTYCEAGVTAHQKIIDDYGWTITGDKDCNFVSSIEVTGVSTSDVEGKKIMTVSGVDMIDDSISYVTVASRSLVSFNGVELPFCTDGTGLTSAYLRDNGAAAAYVSDDPPCYYAFDDTIVNLLITPTQALIWLPSDFDTTAPGTVSVNGSNTYTFNAADGNGGNDNNNNDTITPTIDVNGNKAITKTPTIPARPTFSGVAEPGATVKVTVHSDPVTCTATADSSGNWSCTLPTSLAPGTHTVYIEVTNPDGSVVELGPYSVVVKANSGTTTVNSDTPLAPDTGLQELLQQRAQQTSSQQKTTPLLAIVGLLAIALSAVTAAVYLLLRKQRTVRRFHR